MKEKCGVNGCDGVWPNLNRTLFPLEIVVSFSTRCKTLIQSSFPLLIVVPSSSRRPCRTRAPAGCCISSVWWLERIWGDVECGEISNVNTPTLSALWINTQSPSFDGLIISNVINYWRWLNKFLNGILCCSDFAAVRLTDFGFYVPVWCVHFVHGKSEWMMMTKWIKASLTIESETEPTRKMAMNSECWNKIVWNFENFQHFIQNLCVKLNMWGRKPKQFSSSEKFQVFQPTHFSIHFPLRLYLESQRMWQATTTKCRNDNGESWAWIKVGFNEKVSNEWKQPQ